MFLHKASSFYFINYTNLSNPRQYSSCLRRRRCKIHYLLYFFEVAAGNYIPVATRSVSISYMEIINPSKTCWYAAKTKNNSEKKVKSLLEKFNVEHFLPIRKTLSERNGKKVHVLKPLVPNLVFIHTDFKTALSLVNDSRFPMSYMIDYMTRSLLVVPDKQMKDFMFLLDFSEEAVQVSNENLRRGDRVRVIKGDFAGIEGELVRIKGHKRVVVRLEGLFSLATTYIPGSFLEKIDL